MYGVTYIKTVATFPKMIFARPSEAVEQREGLLPVISILTGSFLSYSNPPAHETSCIISHSQRCSTHIIYIRDSNTTSTVFLKILSLVSLFSSRRCLECLSVHV